MTIFSCSNVMRVAATAVFVLTAPTVTPAQPQPQRIPDRLTDQEFWKLISDLSEPGGFFRSDNFLSNERQFQYVIPALQQTTKPGGVYLGVGPEQNFTYIVAVKPKLSIIFDIRRQNMIEHLMYKALFELSPDRGDFVSRLFCRPRPPGLDSTTAPTALLEAFRGQARDTVLGRKTLTAMKDALKRRGLALTAADLTSLDYVYDAFCTAGPAMDYAFPTSRSGFGRGMPTYAELMAATDADSAGVERSYLAREANYQYLRSLQVKNLIVPVVGDFAGPKAIRAAAQYLKDRHATVSAFYLSNVEQYLFQQGEDWRRFFENVATLPLDSTSTFIRSIGGYGRGFGPGRLGSVLSSMQEVIKAFDEGKVLEYGDVIRMSR